MSKNVYIFLSGPVVSKDSKFPLIIGCVAAAVLSVAVILSLRYLIRTRNSAPSYEQVYSICGQHYPI